MSNQSDVKRVMIIGVSPAEASVSGTAILVDVSRTTVSRIITAYTHLSSVPSVKRKSVQKLKLKGSERRLFQKHDLAGLMNPYLHYSEKCVLWQTVVPSGETPCQHWTRLQREQVGWSDESSDWGSSLFLRKKNTDDEYRSILADHLHLKLPTTFPGGRPVFQDDNGLVHTFC
ncbi:hypothetical protein TNCV_1657421 [Trichonephila clavipes]|nr:hypothetical protein TNCV_1657421 [Trichonephila clavipes]